MKNVKNKILFVCHGNICRSPMAEYIFKSLTDKYIVQSRAISKEEIENDIHPKAKEMLIKNNIPFKKHIAKQITQQDYENFDLIICFDEYNLSDLKRMFKEDKIRKLNDNDVDDPWYTGNFKKTYKEIYEGCLQLIRKLEQ